jgi:hypothetical protein
LGFIFSYEQTKANQSINSVSEDNSLNEDCIEERIRTGFDFIFLVFFRFRAPGLLHEHNSEVAQNLKPHGFL